MKFTELENKKTVELVADLANIKKELFNLRIQKAQGKVEKPSRFRECRRDYARIKTKLTQIRMNQEK